MMMRVYVIRLYLRALGCFRHRKSNAVNVSDNQTLHSRVFHSYYKTKLQLSWYSVIYQSTLTVPYQIHQGVQIPMDPTARLFSGWENVKSHCTESTQTIYKYAPSGWFSDE